MKKVPFSLWFIWLGKKTLVNGSNGRSTIMRCSKEMRSSEEWSQSFIIEDWNAIMKKKQKESRQELDFCKYF
jgi:hypothetical protein